MPDLDQAQEDRINPIAERYYAGDKSALTSIFLSERVAKSIAGEKTLTSSFNLNKVLGILPFTPVVYSITCPLCITRENFASFKSLVSAGLVVPILLGRYSNYPDEVQSFVATHDHIYSEELDYFRGWSLGPMSDADTHASGHDIIARMETVVGDRRNQDKYLEVIGTFHENFFPYTNEDMLILELALEFCNKRRLSQLKRVGRLGSAINEFRTARALNAATLIDETELRNLPTDGGIYTDAARAASEDIKKLAAKGLGILVPTELPIEAYIEIVKDYQPRITATVNSVTPQQNVKDRAIHLYKNVTDINAEIDRLMRSRRFVALEACLNVYRNNALLLGGAAVAAAMGLAGSVLGCASAAAFAAGLKFAKRKGLIKEDASVQRMGRMIARDLQPYTDALMATYLGATGPAINVLSLRRRILNASTKQKSN